MPAVKRKIYLASSWRNIYQPKAVKELRAAGHEVYDFRNPTPGNKGFAWSDIDPEWLKWTPERFCDALHHPIASAGYSFDKNALDWCDTCVILLPCGRSAHLEAGYAIGQGKPTLIVLSEERFEPELMYLLSDTGVSDVSKMVSALDRLHNWNHCTSEPGTSVLRWTRYDGTPETLPENRKRKGQILYFGDGDKRADVGFPSDFFFKIGDEWTYLPKRGE